MLFIKKIKKIYSLFLLKLNSLARQQTFTIRQFTNDECVGWWY